MRERWRVISNQWTVAGGVSDAAAALGGGGAFCVAGGAVMLGAPLPAATSPLNWPWRWARNQPPTASPTPPRINSSLPTTRLGRTMRATPPSIIAALVVTLATITLRGGYTSDARPKRKRP